MKPMLLAALLLVCGAAALSAQACLEASTYTVRGTASAVRYDDPNDLAGSTLGAEVGWSPGRARLLFGVARVALDGGRTDPVVGRAEVALSGPMLAGVRLCPSLLAGVSHLDADADGANTVAAGAGVTLDRSASLGGLDVMPFVQLRGLVATATGEILGEDLSATGFALGLEWGLVLRLRALILRGSLALDGFDPALGAAPFPTRAFRIAAGLGF